MNNPKNGAAFPYRALGVHLKTARQRRNESLAEASGAVEIDPETLERVEAGRERPPEDILMLLINHFDLRDQEAVQLWESAGYESSPHDTAAHKTLEQLEKAAVIVLGMDSRIIYSDGLSIDANKSGLVLTFTQTSNQQQLPVSRLGMSYEQAEQVLQTLQTALLYGRQQPPHRLLPPSS